MTIQTDVKSSYRTTTGAFKIEDGSVNLSRCRIKAVVLTGTGTAAFSDGGAGGVIRCTLDNTGTNSIYIPGEGILFVGTPSVTLSGVTAVTIFYG